jgi:uridine phosphorylase
MDYPILEFDSASEAFIEPSKVISKRDVPECCVITFFNEVIDRVIVENDARVLVENRWEDGPHPLYEIEYHGQRLAFFHPGIGAAMSAAMLEEVIAFGCRKFIACGGCGILEPDIAVGHLIAVSAAVRDEGASYHYLPPGREVQAEINVLDCLIQMLNKRNLPHLVGKTWTTSAPYRETPTKIAKRRSEGCLAVEMEAAAMMAVSQFRDVSFGQILYAGDDLSGKQWDWRNWNSRADVRKNLFWLAADVVLSI